VTAPPDTAPDTSLGIGRSTLAAITGAKAVANTALRWIPPFLPTLEVAFGASTTQLTTVLGAGEFAGLSTLASGPYLDRRRERTIMVGSLGLVSLSSIIALTGTLTSFAVAFVVLIVGVANYTVAGHAFISHRVNYRWRARSFGIFEMSWALGLLVGAPIVASLIKWFGWRGPFMALAVASSVTAVVVAVSLQRAPPASPWVADAPTPTDRVPMTATAWLLVTGSATMAMAGISMFVVSGTWLDDAFGVSTGGIGLVAMGFGAVELAASSSIAAFADRIGKLRSTVAGLATLGVGLAVIVAAGDRLAIGIAGLLIFLLGFEYGFVTSLSIVSEAMPDARGATLAIGNAVGTLARGTGTIASGVLYGAFGIGGTAAMCAAAATTSLGCFLVSRRMIRPRIPQRN
jgi:MFS transporter, DHA1 family, inner membrane transport protein